LTALNFAEVAKGYGCSASYLAKGLTLLQAEVTQNIADFLTY
jgi:hypothetical protein